MQDFWTFVSLALVPEIYQKTKYNDDPMQVCCCCVRRDRWNRRLLIYGCIALRAALFSLTSSSCLFMQPYEKNFLASYNRVVGGIFMLQRRGVRYNADKEECELAHKRFYPAKNTNNPPWFLFGGGSLF